MDVIIDACTPCMSAIVMASRMSSSRCLGAKAFDVVHRTFGHAMWLRTWFPDRAWIIRPSMLGLIDDLERHVAEQAAERAGLRLVASVSPLMHTRGRKRVQYVLTAVRLGKEVSQCGFYLQRNAQQQLQGRALLVEQFPKAWIHETV